MFCLQGTYYPHLVHIFYANMHLVVVGVTFRVTMYGQSFLVSSCSIWYVLSMSKLEVFVPSFSPEVQALIHAKLDVIPTSLYGALCLIPSYIPIVGFSKPTWLFAPFSPTSFICLLIVGHLLASFMSFFLDNSLTLVMWSLMLSHLFVFHSIEKTLSHSPFLSRKF